VDLHWIPGAAASADERSAVETVLGPPASGWEGAARTAADTRLAPSAEEFRARRHLLLPVLHAVQARAGWISPGALNYACQRLGVPPAEAYGVASFYALFSLEPRPGTVVHVCDDIACRLAGGLELAAELERRLDAKTAACHRSPCLGQCERAPAALLQVAGPRGGETSLAPAGAGGIEAVLRGGPAPAAASGSSTPQVQSAARGELRLLQRVGRADPESLDDYRAHGGYAALRRALEIGPEAVLREVLDSKLVGRGGAAFPTGRKWEAVARAPVRPHYFVCNADESEPGTFKDRVLMEEDPYALVEAMTIGAFATGCETGYIYIRGEYPLAFRRLAHAVEEARSRGFVGGNILGRGLRFDLEIRRGAGAYICGEETALFNSIEGLRGEPRNKPPFPTQAGLFGKPTVVNNVETLANVLAIVLDGGPAFAAVGKGQSTGTKLFCLSGHVERPGLYEVPMGTTLREILTLAGGVRGGRSLAAVLLGGAAGTFLTPAELDVPLTFEGTRAIGASLGSGVVMAFDDTVDLEDTVLRIAAFFRDESCGQCVPCRVGTVRQEEALQRLAAARPLGSPDQELALVAEVGQAMRDTSICGLGHTASTAVESALRKFALFQRGAGG
jgi:NADH-quinone oxidoreductase subunit F